MESSQKLLEGKFHDEDEDDNDPLTMDNNNENAGAENDEDAAFQSRLEAFARQFDEIMAQNEDKKEDEIPPKLRRDCSL